MIHDFSLLGKSCVLLNLMVRLLVNLQDNVIYLIASVDALFIRVLWQVCTVMFEYYFIKCKCLLPEMLNGHRQLLYHTIVCVSCYYGNDSL